MFRIYHSRNVVFIRYITTLIGSLNRSFIQTNQCTILYGYCRIGSSTISMRMNSLSRHLIESRICKHHRLRTIFFKDRNDIVHITIVYHKRRQGISFNITILITIPITYIFHSCKLTFFNLYHCTRCKLVIKVIFCRITQQSCI